ncbi:sedoheptulokinase-like isoform X2 [Bacillus rossius redtenbacheri]|uniref:sedoheptulokinase-like isoform X2 n=1 Tax=Bacillus rossius redtenbacheri TaxID=93214 RepID=UPI002FDD127F
MGDLVLGVDIGTTSVKVCLVDSVSRQVTHKQAKDTQANVPSDQGSEGNKQDVPKIVSALNSCISRCPKDQLKRVARVGICGQMHGVLLWSERAWEHTSARPEVHREGVSALYTWQDTRCSPAFLSSLPPAQSHLPAYSGYGCPTLFWMARHKPEKLEQFCHAGTVQDFVVAMLCDLDRPVMSVQNAASWGYFDTRSGAWNTDVLEEAGFPVRLLPRVVKPDAIAGKLAESWYGIQAGTPVGAALGDLQCSVYPNIGPAVAVLNISTSAQLAFVTPDCPVSSPETGNVEYFPYFRDSYLAVGASLNGGNALATFVRTLQQWTHELGFNVPQAKVWECVMALAENDAAVSTLRVVPTLLGERHSPEQNATVSNIDPGNLGLGQVFRALCRGLIQNLHSMMPREMLLAAHIEHIVGIGSALTRNKVLQKEVQHWYQLPVQFVSGRDAAMGAACAALDS